MKVPYGYVRVSEMMMKSAVTGERMNRKFGIRDCLFLAVLFLLGIVLTAAIYIFSDGGSEVRITVDGQLYGTYALSEPQEIPIELEGRTANVVVIENGEARMLDADCPDGLCMHQGAISRDGQTIVCLPHKLVVEVVGGEKETYDSISG